jgi:hypothetical protein
VRPRRRSAAGKADLRAGEHNDGRRPRARPAGAARPRAGRLPRGSPIRGAALPAAAREHVAAFLTAMAENADLGTRTMT